MDCINDISSYGEKALELLDTEEWKGEGELLNRISGPYVLGMDEMCFNSDMSKLVKMGVVERKGHPWLKFFTGLKYRKIADLPIDRKEIVFEIDVDTSLFFEQVDKGKLLAPRDEDGKRTMVIRKK